MNLSQIFYDSSKLILLGSVKDTIYSSTSTRCDVIMTSICIYYIVFFYPHCCKHKMELSEKRINFRTFSGLHSKEKGFKISKLKKI